MFVSMQVNCYVCDAIENVLDLNLINFIVARC